MTSSGPDGAGDAGMAAAQRPEGGMAAVERATAAIGAMSAEASVNAVYANKIAAIEDPGERAAFVAARRAEQEADFTLLRMGGELIVDAVVPPARLRDELARRLAAADGWERPAAQRHHAVSPV